MMPGLFDEQFLLRKLDQMGNLLARLDGIVDWQAFLPTIEKNLGREVASSAWRKPYPTLFMFKILICQSLYNISDEDTERELLKISSSAVSLAFQGDSSGRSRIARPFGASGKP